MIPNNFKYEDYIVWNVFPQVIPPKYGHYLVYREKCDKLHFETWNGSGWAYNGNNITMWAEIQKPKLPIPT